MSNTSPKPPSWRLRAVKGLHTLAWAFFAGCTLVLPLAVWRGELQVAATLAAFVMVEVFILLLNHWSCPLTRVAARYTQDRSANFDIYLPEPLARSNKAVFGGIYLSGLGYLLVRWLTG
jgi:hypothetical protein